MHLHNPCFSRSWLCAPFPIAPTAAVSHRQAMLAGVWDDPAHEAALIDELEKYVRDGNAAEALLSGVMLFGRAILFLFMLSFIMAILRWYYTELTLGARWVVLGPPGGPGG